MFALSKTPIEDHPMLDDFARAEAGAMVVFEGRVRIQNQGRTVQRLEYESANPTLAENVFMELERETLARFDVLDVHCVHRVGTLTVGDRAVWIGVLAAHRDPAFKACRFVIDELKKRLPIWKKEHYTDGDSGWIEHA